MHDYGGNWTESKAKSADRTLGQVLLVTRARYTNVGIRSEKRKFGELRTYRGRLSGGKWESGATKGELHCDVVRTRAGP